VFVTYATSSAAETGFLDRSNTISGNTYRYQVHVPVDYVSSRSQKMIGCQTEDRRGVVHRNAANCF
jgi:hypothetical protein